MIECFNDGSRNAPRLRLGQTLWGMIGLPLNCKADAAPEWSLDEKFARCREAGFEAVECWLDDENEREVKDALDRHNLKLVLGFRLLSKDDAQLAVERALRLGADFLFAQPFTPYTPLNEVTEIALAARQIANDAGLPLFFETHRNDFTETIRQTNEMIEAIPDIGITGDFSHFVVGGEFYGWKEENAIGRMEKVMPRIRHLHGRVSNGEAVQVDVGNGDTQAAKFFVEIWTEAMRHWLQGAQPGDVLQFSSELGPPQYAITLPDGREFSDRWAQSLVLKKLAEQAWQNAQNS